MNKDKPKPSTIVCIKGDYNATYRLKNTVCRSYEITPDGDYVLVLETARGATIDSRQRQDSYETFRRLRKGLPASAVMVEDLDPEDVNVAPGSLRTTVVLEDRSGPTLLLSPNDVPKVLEAVEQSLRPLQIDAADLADRILLNCTIIAAITSRENRVAAMLALYLAWHHPAGGAPSDIKAALEEHNRACITFGFDRRSGGEAMIVWAEYEDPFSSISDVHTAAFQPAQGTA